MDPSPSFQITTHAKCILAGEHAVLRGSPAIIFPVKSRTLELTYKKCDGITANFDAPFEESLMALFWGMLQTSAQLLAIPLHHIKGKFFLKNNIPMGSGMGFSSVLCVTLAKWFVYKNYLPEEKLFDFAKSLEDNFHGKSSGVDIAGVLADSGIIYKQNTRPKALLPQWQPLLYISSSDSTSSTAKCIQKVEKLWEKDPIFALQIDEDMKNSVFLIEQAFSSNEKTGFPLLAQALQKACHCFERWRLITAPLQQHMNLLLENGAVAVKPTGSGAGGYVLSLWQQPPKLSLEMIKLL